MMLLSKGKIQRIHMEKAHARERLQQIAFNVNAILKKEKPLQEEIKTVIRKMVTLVVDWLDDHDAALDAIEAQRKVFKEALQPITTGLGFSINYDIADGDGDGDGHGDNRTQNKHADVRFRGWQRGPAGIVVENVD